MGHAEPRVFILFGKIITDIAVTQPYDKRATVTQPYDKRTAVTQTYDEISVGWIFILFFLSIIVFFIKSFLRRPKLKLPHYTK